MPPAVGIDDTISAMHSATTRINAATTGQPIEIMTGPPLFHAAKKFVKQPARMEMMENEIAKLVNPPHDRSSSCLYPSSASSRSEERRVGKECRSRGLR